MEKTILKNRILKRTSSLLLTAAFTLGAFSLYPGVSADDTVAPVGQIAASEAEPVTVGAANGLAYNTRYIHHWKKVSYQSDFIQKSGKYCTLLGEWTILCWARNGVGYFSTGEDTEAGDNHGIVCKPLGSDPAFSGLLTNYNDDPKLQTWAEEFYTSSTRDYGLDFDPYDVKLDDDNSNLPMFNVFNYKNQGLWNWNVFALKFLDNNTFWKKDHDERHLGVCCDYDDKDKDDGLWRGAVKMYFNLVNVTDSMVTPDETYQVIRARRSDCGSKWDALIMYLSHSEQIMAITKDYTVPSGTTLQLKADAMLADGVRLRIEPGAVVTLDGKFFNNGIIENYGTLLLYDGARLTFLDPTTVGASSIYNYGNREYTLSATGKKVVSEGDMVVMPGALVVMNNQVRTDPYGIPILGAKAGATFTIDGGSLTNYGTVIYPGSFNMKNAHIANKEGGIFMSGIRLTAGFGMMPALPESSLNNVSALKNTFGIIGAGYFPRVSATGVSYVENDGEMSCLTDMPELVASGNVVYGDMSDLPMA